MAKDVAQLIKVATQAVKDVPENLRPVAFQKAFDFLAGEQSSGGTPAPSPASKGQRSTRSDGKRQRPKASSDSNRSQLDQLDRTSQPKISQVATALANSLRVLQAAHDELGIDGLSASDIAHVLNDKFRCRITRRAVSLALNGAGRFVNRQKEGNSVLFKIMSGGEQHLSDLDSDRASEPAKSPRKSNSAKISTATKADAGSTSSSGGTLTKKTKAKAKGAKKSSKKKSKSLGQKALLLELIKDGFFRKPKTLPQIIDELKHKYGRTFKPNEMSTPLLRLLRDKALTRTQNSDNQYEYKNA